jgi:hypothetical protein
MLTDTYQPSKHSEWYVETTPHLLWILYIVLIFTEYDVSEVTLLPASNAVGNTHNLRLKPKAQPAPETKDKAQQ